MGRNALQPKLTCRKGRAHMFICLSLGLPGVSILEAHKDANIREVCSGGSDLSLLILDPWNSQHMDSCAATGWPAPAHRSRAKKTLSLQLET